MTRRAALPEPTLRKPHLVATAEAGDGTLTPLLRARRCACGHISLPPQAYGCERCGAAGAGEAIALRARGELRALVAVHVHGKLPTPYTLGRVLLDDGAAIEVCLESAEAPPIGTRVCGRLVPVTDQAGVEALDLRFGPEEGVS
jgi:uncharacterized OB-fold protein